MVTALRKHVPSSPGTARPSRAAVAQALDLIAAIGADALADWAAELRAERDLKLRRLARLHGLRVVTP